MSQLLRRWGLWLFFFWLLVFAFSYHLMHFPLLAIVAPVVLSIVIDVLAVSVLLTLAGALGKLLLRSLDGLSLPEQVALQSLLGLGVISLSVLVVGMLGLLPPTWLGWVITLGCLGVFHRPALAWVTTLKDTVRQLLGADINETTFTGWMRAGILVLLFLAGLLTLAPPIQWDSLTYHLAGPRIYIDTGRIIGFPELHYLGFPFLTEMLYMWLMILARPQTAAMLHWCVGTLMLIVMLGLARRINQPAAGWTAVAILMAGGLVWEEFHWAYSDLAAMAYVLAGLTLLLAWRDSAEQQRTGMLITAGVFIGFAMGTKYTVAGPAIGLGILVLYSARHDGFPALARAGSIVSVVALIVFLPWLLRNVALHGNPVAPFIWGTTAYDQYDQSSYLRLNTGRTAVSLLLAPVQGTIFGLLREGPGDAGGPLLVSLLPLAAIGWKKRTAEERRVVTSLLVFALPPYLLWLFGISLSYSLSDGRLLLPLLPAVALVGAIGLESLGELVPDPDIEKLIRVVVSASLALATFAAAISLVGADYLKAAFGVMSESDYLNQALPAHYDAMQYINTELSEDAHILFLWDPRVFYCRRNCIPDSLLNQWWHDLQVEPDPRQIAQRWRERGITHVLIWDAGMQNLLSPEMKYEMLTSQDVADLEIVRREDLTLVKDFTVAADVSNDVVIYTLYELKDNGQP